MENTSPAVLCLDCQHGYHDIPFHLPQVQCSCPCHGPDESIKDALPLTFPLDTEGNPTYNKDVEA